jgi:hypothetical protein
MGEVIDLHQPDREPPKKVDSEAKAAAKRRHPSAAQQIIKDSGFKLEVVQDDEPLA